MRSKKKNTKFPLVPALLIVTLLTGITVAAMGSLGSQFQGKLQIMQKETPQKQRPAAQFSTGNPDGSRIVIGPDGKSHTINPDGSEKNSGQNTATDSHECEHGYQANDGKTYYNYCYITDFKLVQFYQWLEITYAYPFVNTVLHYGEQAPTQAEVEKYSENPNPIKGFAKIKSFNTLDGYFIHNLVGGQEGERVQEDRTFLTGKVYFKDNSQRIIGITAMHAGYFVLGQVNEQYMTGNAGQQTVNPDGSVSADAPSVQGSGSVGISMYGNPIKASEIPFISKIEIQLKNNTVLVYKNIDAPNSFIDETYVGTPSYQGQGSVTPSN